MSVMVQASGKVVTAYLSGDIDHHTAKGIRMEIDDTIERLNPELLILDFSEVHFMDSSGIGLVMGRYKKLQLTGGNLEISSASPRITRVMKLSGRDKLVKM